MQSNLIEYFNTFRRCILNLIKQALYNIVVIKTINIISIVNS